MANKTTLAKAPTGPAASTPPKATVSGEIMIGTLEIPISTQIPPDVPGTFSFSYAADPATAITIPVGAFIEWAAAAVDSNIKSDDLPSSLRTLNVAVAKLSFDTTGNFDIQVQLGKKDGTPPAWDPSWAPIPGLTSFKISKVTLEVIRTVAS